MDPSAPIAETKMWGLLRRRQCLLPTWKAWLLLLVVLGPSTFFTVRGLHSFLCLTRPVPGGALVVEGWAADYALEQAAVEFKRNHYQKIFVTGGPIEYGAPLSEYHTYAERGAAVLEKLGLNTNQVQAVPAPYAAQDRTYVAAMTLRRWWREHRLIPGKVELFTEGLHARRSRLMFQRALGKGAEVGVISIPARDYDPQHWWRYSAGVRGVIGEAIAYVYAAVLFHPPKDDNASLSIVR
jgi:uncharacterized SAM-binding protein YcdF (DUF218 family)